MKIVQRDLHVCTNCVTALLVRAGWVDDVRLIGPYASGHRGYVWERPGVNYAQEEALDDNWPDWWIRLAPGCPSCREEEVTVSDVPCDGCSSPTPGRRYPAIATRKLSDLEALGRSLEAA